LFFKPQDKKNSVFIYFCLLSNPGLNDLLWCKYLNNDHWLIAMGRKYCILTF
jgi:hypothetical protein